MSFIAGYLLGLGEGGGDSRLQKLRSRPCRLRIDIDDVWSIQLKIDDANYLDDPVETRSSLYYHSVVYGDNSTSYSNETAWGAYFCVYRGDELLYALGQYFILGKAAAYSANGELYNMRYGYIDDVYLVSVTQRNRRDFPRISVACTNKTYNYDIQNNVLNDNYTPIGVNIKTESIGGCDLRTSASNVKEFLITDLTDDELTDVLMQFNGACGRYYDSNHAGE